MGRIILQRVICYPLVRVWEVTVLQTVLINQPLLLRWEVQQSWINTSSMEGPLLKWTTEGFSQLCQNRSASDCFLWKAWLHLSVEAFFAAVKCNERKEVSDVLVFLTFPPLLLCTVRQMYAQETLRAMKGVSSHERALRHVFSPTGFQVKPVLKEHYFWEGWAFSCCSCPLTSWTGKFHTLVK